MASGRLERQERADILVEVDNVAQYHYKLKFFMRINYAFAHEAVAEDEAAQWLVKGVIGETSFGELVQGDALNAAAKDADEEDSSSEENFSSNPRVPVIILDGSRYKGIILRIYQHRQVTVLLSMNLSINHHSLHCSRSLSKPLLPSPGTISDHDDPRSPPVPPKMVSLPRSQYLDGSISFK